MFSEGHERSFGKVDVWTIAISEDNYNCAAISLSPIGNAL
jgi:hypothetical protein